MNIVSKRKVENVISFTMNTTSVSFFLLVNYANLPPLNYFSRDRRLLIFSLSFLLATRSSGHGTIDYRRHGYASKTPPRHWGRIMTKCSRHFTHFGQMWYVRGRLEGIIRPSTMP